MQIFIIFRTLLDVISLTLESEAKDSILNLKQKIEKASGYTPFQQLVFKLPSIRRYQDS